MATILNTLYPPQVETFMPSFCYNDSAKIWFNISSYNEDQLENIRYIHVSMVDQRNNQNVFAGINNNKNIVYPQYYPISFNWWKENNNKPNSKMGYDPNKKMYWLVIPPEILKTNVPLKSGEEATYNFEQYYKVQLRFDLTGSPGFPAHNNYSDPTDYFKLVETDVIANALQLASYTNSNENNFSEWSTGVLLKPIGIPKLEELLLQGFELQSVDDETEDTAQVNPSTEDIVQVNPSTDVPIAGKIHFKRTNGTDIKESEEYLLWYQIEVLLLENNRTVVVYDSNKINPEALNQINYNLNLFTSNVGANYNYIIKIIYQTNNGYLEDISYPIKIVDYENNFTLANYTKDIDEENGVIIFNIDTEYTDGYLIMRRSSYYSNFTKWDLIAAYDMSRKKDGTVVIIDNTIESMVGYRYQLQYITVDNNIYRPIYIEHENSNIIHCDFYGALFSDSQRKLRMTFNFEASGRTNAVNRTKTDTLGGQYPIFTQNAKLKYHTYNISGRISTEDNGELFLSKEEVFGDEYYNYRYNKNNSIEDTSYLGGSSGSSVLIEKIQSDNDWLYEREYRDAVEEWLNNGKPKLFRSMTEGNMIVMLDSISMTPDTVLGRRLYDVSATMYEIGNGKNIEDIASFGLFDIIDQR